MTYESILERVKKIIDEHDENTCKTCESLRTLEKMNKELAEINKIRIADGLDPIDSDACSMVLDHCPICLGPLFDGGRWCSRKCHEEWMILKRGRGIV